MVTISSRASGVTGPLVRSVSRDASASGFFPRYRSSRKPGLTPEGSFSPGRVAYLDGEQTQPRSSKRNAQLQLAPARGLLPALAEVTTKTPRLEESNCSQPPCNSYFVVPLWFSHSFPAMALAAAGGCQGHTRRVLLRALRWSSCTGLPRRCSERLGAHGHERRSTLTLIAATSCDCVTRTSTALSGPPRETCDQRSLARCSSQRHQRPEACCSGMSAGGQLAE